MALVLCNFLSNTVTDILYFCELVDVVHKTPVLKVKKKQTGQYNKTVYLPPILVSGCHPERLESLHG